MPVAPGVTYVHRTTSKPLHIHMLRIDLLHPRVGFRTAIANDVVYGSPERTSSLAARKGLVRTGRPQVSRNSSTSAEVAPPVRKTKADTTSGWSRRARW